MTRSRYSQLEAIATERAETMLALAEVRCIDLEALAFVGRRFERCLRMMDAAEPAQRAQLEQLVAEDFEGLATTFKVLARLVDRAGTA